MKNVFPNPTGQGDVFWNGRMFAMPSGEECRILEYSLSETTPGWNDNHVELLKRTTNFDLPIDRASRRMALRSIDECSKVIGESFNLLEIGCSDGFLLKQLRQLYPDAAICGTDLSMALLRRLAVQLDAEGFPTPFLRLDIAACPNLIDIFDIVVALNVLEHIKDDVGAVNMISRILKPGGMFIFEIPASPALYDNYDSTLGHYRRYDIKRIKYLFDCAGLQIINISHIGFFIYPFFFMVKKIIKILDIKYSISKSWGGEENSKMKKLFSLASGRFSEILFNFELKLGIYINYFFGIRIIGIAKKI
jgi:SAM-dependent methyltransferase